VKRILILFLLANLTSGCPVFIPLSSDHREEIDKVQGQIAIGSTTKEEVISILGPPDVTRDRFILYRHKEYSGGAIVGFIVPLPIVGGAGGGVAGQVFMDLYFEFDDYGVLIDFRTDKYDESLRSVEEK